MKVGIIGLGLIGGSIKKGLEKAKGFEIVSSSESCDCLVIATPIETIIPIAKKICKTKKGPLLVLDVGSVKKDIAFEFEKISGDLEFLPTHPMAGSEKSGFKASSETLFQGRIWIVTPHKKTTKKGLNMAKKIISALGAKMVIRNPLSHDLQVALVSHIPYLLACKYRDFVESFPEALELKGPGFDSFTRLSFDNKKMHQQIYKKNKEFIDQYLGEFCAHISKKA